MELKWLGSTEKNIASEHLRQSKKLMRGRSKFVRRDESDYRIPSPVPGIIRIITPSAVSTAM